MLHVCEECVACMLRAFCVSETYSGKIPNSILFKNNIAYFVFLVSRGGWAALPRGAMGLSAVCDCGIS